MPDNVRLILILLCICGMGYIGYNIVDSAISDNLEAKSLGILYNQQNTLYKDPAAMKEFLNHRYGDSYRRTGELVYAMDGKPDQVIAVDADKATAVDMMLQWIGATQMKKFNRAVGDIKYSTDGKYAYVSTMETSSGIIDFTVSPEKKTSLTYESANNCLDTLTVVRGVTHWMATQCKQKIALFQ